MKPSTEAITVLLIGGLLLSSVASVIVVAENETENGIPENETQIYRSEDSDKYISDENYTAQYEENRTGLAALANGTDIYFSEHPDEVATWNDNDFEQLQSDFSTDDDQSIQPRNVTTKDSQFIKDAYVETYRISPSTQLHRSEGETIRYIAQEGEVMATVDYRVDDPVDDLDPSDGELVEWQLLDSEIEGTCVVEDEPPIEEGCSGLTMGGTADANDDTHTPRFNYTVHGTGQKETTVTVVTEIDVRFKKITEIEKTRIVEECEEVETENGTTIECNDVEETYWDETVEYFDDSVTVTDTHQNVNSRAPQQVIQKVVHPDGQVDYGVTIEGKPWSTFHAEEDLTATSRWRYYSRSNDSWGSLVAKTESGSSERDLHATPLRIHGFPAEEGYTTSGNESTTSEVKFATRTEVETPPSLPAEIDVPVANSSYNYTRSYAILAAGEDHNLSTNTVVRNEHPITVLGPTIHIRETNLDVKIIEENTSHILVEATLTENETGDPISLTNRKSAINIQGQSKSTNSSGKAQFRVKKDQYIDAEFNATPWYETNQPKYAPSDEFIVVKNTELYRHSIEQLFKLAVQGGSVVLMMIYLIDFIPWIDVWPPWRKFP